MEPLQDSCGVQPSSRARRPATEEMGREKQIAPALVPGPAVSLMERMMADFSSLWATI